MNERGLVEVPENAVRDEPIAFGLTGIQLGICGVAVLVAAALNLLPVWEPIRIGLIVVAPGPSPSPPRCRSRASPPIAGSRARSAISAHRERGLPGSKAKMW